MDSASLLRVVYALVTLGGLGIVFGLGLYAASRVFHVQVDPRVDSVTNALPGANCGACGFPGCGGLATAIVHGSAPPDSCPVCSSGELAAVAAIMGVSVEAGEPKTAIVRCQGRDVADRFAYNGPQTCEAADLLIAGQRACRYGCLGFGDCVRVCKFGAISIVDGVACVDRDRCVACGKCVAACPRYLIDLQPAAMLVHVLCRSRDKGAAVRKCCAVGCIGCKKCEKECAYDAIHVTDFLAEIDYEKCTNCGACVEVCPTHAIVHLKTAQERQVVKETS